MLHGLGHIRQVAELVRARKYRAGAAPLSGARSAFREFWPPFDPCPFPD
jgi:hypothetical protein